jgi:hypothetical protein
MGERRGSRRQRSLLRGLLFVSAERGGMACLVRDLSDKGARVIFSDTVALPEMVDLHLPQRGLKLRARVKWRRQDEIGLSFVESDRVPAADSTAAEVAERVAVLEAEITSLRKLLGRLKRASAKNNGEAAA